MTNYQIFSNLINVLLSLHEVQVVPALPVPTGHEPDIALVCEREYRSAGKEILTSNLGLGHLQSVGLAHDVAGRRLVEVGDDDLGASLLQVLQVLQYRLIDCRKITTH